MKILGPPLTLTLLWTGTRCPNRTECIIGLCRRWFLETRSPKQAAWYHGACPRHYLILTLTCLQGSHRCTPISLTLSILVSNSKLYGALFFSRLRLMHEPTQRRDMHIFLLCREVYCTDCRVIFCGRRRFERWCQRRLRSIVLTRAADGGVNFAPVALSSFTVCSGFSPQ